MATMPPDGKRRSGAAERTLGHWRAEAGKPAAERAVPVAEEAPIAFNFNGAPFAVMMASPTELDDFAIGFALAEGIVASAKAIADVTITADGPGYAIAMTVPEADAARLAEGERAVAGTASCGLCGSRTLESALRSLPYRAGGPAMALPTVHGAIQRLAEHQPLSRRTGAVHAAGFVTPDGTIQAVREDVGRHNALDKLIGALVRAGRSPREGAVLMTSRCSVELVQKAVTVGVPVVATISAPTTLAIDMARQAGLSLAALVRPDGLLVCADLEARLAAE
jgi:FdhD protein